MQIPAFHVVKAGIFSLLYGLGLRLFGQVGAHPDKPQVHPDATETGAQGNPPPDAA